MISRQTSESVGNKPFDILVDNLNKEFTELQPDGSYGSGEVITQLLSDYIKNNEDWQDYAFFCPHRYSRNLVARTDIYELMVICWSKGQASPIHNHEGQRCWMACASGQLQETQFIFQNTKSPKGFGPVEQSQVSTIDQGTVGYITDEIALHVIESLEPTSVSIHLYSKPITECNIYCPLTGAITRRKLGYFTQYKEKCLNNTVSSSSCSATAPTTTTTTNTTLNNITTTTTTTTTTSNYSGSTSNSCIGEPQSPPTVNPNTSLSSHMTSTVQSY